MLENPWLMAWESPCILWTCYPLSRYTWFSSQLHQGSPDSCQKSTLPSLGLGQIFWISLTCNHCKAVEKALDVLCEEIVKSVHGTTEKEKAVQPTCVDVCGQCVYMIGVKAAEVGASDGPYKQPMCISFSCPMHVLFSHLT